MPKKPEDEKEVLKGEQLPLFDEMTGASPATDSAVDPDESGLAVIPDIDETAGTALFSTNPTDFDMGDIVPPLLRLGQGLSPEVQEGVAKPGQWLLSGFDALDSVIVVPLAFARRRELRDNDTNSIMCSSNNGELGVGEPGGLCADCPMNKWSGEGKNRKPPACTFFYSYMVYITEFDTAALINFKKTALGSARMLNSLIQRHKFGSLAVKLTAKSQKGKKGSYFIPQIGVVTQEDAKVALEQAKIYVQ